MDSSDNLVKKAFQHMPAWTLAIMGWFVTNPYIRAQLGGKGMNLLTALFIAPVMLCVAGVISIFGGMLSAWVLDLYETKIRGQKHLYVWVILACVVAVLFVWITMNIEVHPGLTVVE